MRAEDTWGLAWGALVAHKMRTALTLLGLVIGVSSLILVMTLIQGANTFVEAKIVRLGKDVFLVTKQPIVSTNFQEILEGQKHRDLTLDDWRAVQDQCVVCRAVGVQAETLVRVRTEAQSLADVSVRGESASMREISTLDLTAGRYFTEAEMRTAAPVAIIGEDIVERLFARRNPLGKTLRVAGEEFAVLGVVEPVGNSPLSGRNYDKMVRIPISAFQKLFGMRRSVMLQVKAPARGAALADAQDEVRQILRARRHVAAEAKDDFYITTAETYLKLWSDISSVFFLVFVLISSVASLVGGIVIMNITLVSVTERTKEIGLRRSVGATQRDIAGQFLVEVLAQCLAGGVAGVLLGFSVAVVLRQFTPFPADVEPWVAVLGLLLASVIALVFGVYPAMKAARLDPVVALRSE